MDHLMDLNHSLSVQMNTQEEPTACMERYVNNPTQDESTTDQHQSGQLDFQQDEDIALGQIGLPTLHPIDANFDSNEWNDFLSNTNDVDSFVSNHDDQSQPKNKAHPEMFADPSQQWEIPYDVDAEDQSNQHHGWSYGVQIDPQLELDSSPLNHLSDGTFLFNEEDTVLAGTEDDYSMTTQPMETTPGFAAVPNDPLYTPYLSIPYDESLAYPNPSVYPDFADLTYTADPYFVTQPNHYYGYVPDDGLEQGFASEQYSTGFTHTDSAQQYAIGYDQGLQFDHLDVKPTVQELSGQSNTHLDFEQVYTPSESNGRQRSYRGNRRQIKVDPTSTHDTEEPRRCSATSSTSSTSSLNKPVAVKVYRAGCKPQRPKEKWWLRINSSTQGETTRTAKIEEWENEYKFRPLPIGNWSTGKFQFTYAHNFETEQLQNTPMSARKVHEYITRYPAEGKKSLVLWIQRTPADSGRRYGSKEHSECIFKNCPKRMVGQEGTIDVGHYRVAFDEKFTFYDGKVDPFDCPAYAHLYCMERFLDFEYICDVADVRADVRSDMPLEPNGKAAFSFLGKPQLPILKKFVRAASVGKLRDTSEFRDYPYHEDYAPGSRKLHDLTLVYHMSTASWDTKTRSLKLQFLERNLTPNQQGVNRGDLEMAMVDKKVKELEKKNGRDKKKKGQSVERNLMALYEQCDPEITRRISLLKEELVRIREEEAAGKGKARQTPTRKKRKTSEWDEDDQEEYAQRDRRGGDRVSSSHNKRQRMHSPVDDPQLQPSSYLARETHPGYILPQHTSLSLTPEYNGDNPLPQNQCPLPIDPALLSEYNPQFNWHPVDPVPLFPELSIDDFPVSQVESQLQSYIPSMTDAEIQELLALQRRQSVILEPSGGGIMKSSGHGKRESRHVGFKRQPVSEKKEFCADDPPKGVSEARGERRSARIARRRETTKG